MIWGIFQNSTADKPNYLQLNKLSLVKTIQAHKIILSACSDVFKGIFQKQSNLSKQYFPYIYMRGITYENLTSIVDFIYNGEVNVAQEDLNSFLTIAEELKIKVVENQM